MANTYELISSYTATGSVASIDFTSIPSTFTDLLVKVSGRAVATSSYPNVRVRFNSDTGANYKWRRIYGDGTGATSDSNSSDTGALVGLIAGSNETANTFSNFEFVIPNYLSSNQKSISSDAVSENNSATSYSYLLASLWTGTSAITSISLYSSYNFAQYSTAYLYGIKSS
jgi:hypothetical protein